MKYRYYIMECDENDKLVDLWGTNAASDAWDIAKWACHIVIDTETGDRLLGWSSTPRQEPIELFCATR